MHVIFAGYCVDMPRINWTRDEIILVAALVAENNWRPLDGNDRRIAELSELLQRPWLHPLEGRPEAFRNTNGVGRKSSDIATAHPDYRGRPTRGNRLDGEVVADFIEDPRKMFRVAAEIRRAIEDGEAVARPTGEHEAEALEGRLLTARHYRRERDPVLRRKKVEQVLARGGDLSCEACGFNFGTAYGERGARYVEVHHRRPLHDSGPRVTKLSDLALLCANCHRMIHVKSPWLTVEELAELVRAHAR